MRTLLAVAIAAFPVAARANSAAWFDPDNGCGRGAAFVKTGKMADLPGCTGRLPKNPPAIEVLLHDAKRDLVDAETWLGKNKLDKVDAVLEKTRLAISHTPGMNPELPDRWDEARPLYERAIASLQNRRKLIPHLEKMRAVHDAAVAAGKSMTDKERDGGPADALAKAQACAAEFAETRAAGIDFAVDVELEPGKLRPLDEALADCDQVRKQAEPLVRAEELAKKAKRAEWRKKLKGDRLKVFDAHPGALPEVADAKAAAKATAWKYTTKAGVETITFKGNKIAATNTVPAR